MVLWNISDRNFPTGIHVGKDGKSIVLHIPGDFDSLKHYGVTCELHKVEVCLLQPIYIPGFVFTNHPLKYSLSFSPRLCKFDIVYALAFVNTNQSALNLVKIYMTNRSGPNRTRTNRVICP